MLELYHHGSSVCASKVRLVLAEKGLDWHGHYVDIHKSEQFTPEYLKLNPKAVVPTLVNHGRVICESTVIMEYLDEEFPDQPLVPHDSYSRAQMRIWTKAVDEDLHPACGMVTFAACHRYRVMRMSEADLKAFLDAVPDPNRRERKRIVVHRGFQAPEARTALQVHANYINKMEVALEASDWLVGNDITLADVAVTPYLNRLQMLYLFDILTQDRPRVRAWFDRIRSRPSFEPAINKWMPQDLTDDFETFGKRSAPEAVKIIETLEMATA